LDIYCRNNLHLSTEHNAYPTVAPSDQVLDVNDQGLVYCQIHLENVGTDALRGLALFVAVTAAVAGRPGVLVSKAGDSNPQLSFGQAVTLGPYDSISIGKVGQSRVSPWFVLKSRPNVEEIMLFVTASAQNAVQVSIGKDIPVRRNAISPSR
jgi:hypothetical protein